MLRARWAAVGCGALALLAPAAARADENIPAALTAPSYALAWVRAEGAEQCPTGGVLVTEVERRLGRAVFSTAAERSFEVEVTRFGKTYRSDVYVRDAAGNTIGHRSLQSDEPGCSALVSATALAIALVIDPEAAAHEPPPSTGVAAFDPPVVALPPAPPPSPPAPPPRAPAPVPPPAPARREPTPLTASLRAQLTGGLAGATSPGFELAFSARPSKRWGVAVAASYALSRTVTRGIGSLDLGLTRFSGLLSFDAVGSENFRLVLGAGPSLGALHVAVRQPAPVTAPGDYSWIALELATRLQVSVSKDVFVELGGAGLLPVVRQEFWVLGQDQPVWRQPLLSGVGFFGVGALFP